MHASYGKKKNSFRIINGTVLITIDTSRLISFKVASREVPTPLELRPHFAVFMNIGSDYEYRKTMIVQEGEEKGEMYVTVLIDKNHVQEIVLHGLKHEI